MSTLSSWPFYDTAQIKAASQVLESGLVNAWTGSQTSSFEAEFAAWNRSRFAVACANGTLALSAAYSSVGIKPGSELITTPRTFIATASAAVMLGAKPVFADVDLDSGWFGSDDCLCQDSTSHEGCDRCRVPDDEDSDPGWRISNARERGYHRPSSR